jgi:hypothetical protein
MVRDCFCHVTQLPQFGLGFADVSDLFVTRTYLHKHPLLHADANRMKQIFLSHAFRLTGSHRGSLTKKPSRKSRKLPFSGRPEILSYGELPPIIGCSPASLSPHHAPPPIIIPSLTTPYALPSTILPLTFTFAHRPSPLYFLSQPFSPPFTLQPSTFHPPPTTHNPPPTLTLTLTPPLRISPCSPLCAVFYI